MQVSCLPAWRMWRRWWCWTWSNNQLGGTLSDFAFQAAANRADLHSALRYFDIGNNTFAGVSTVYLVCWGPA